MTRVVEGLDEFVREVEEKAWRDELLAEDYAATQLLPSCSGRADFLTRLAVMVDTDPKQAHRLYFAWRDKLAPPPAPRAPIQWKSMPHWLRQMGEDWMKVDDPTREKIRALAPRVWDWMMFAACAKDV